MTIPAARARIDEIHTQFRDSLFRVTQFLHDAEHGFEMVRAQQVEIVERLSAAKAGKPLPDPPGKDLIKIDLKIREVEAIETALTEATAGMDHYPGMLSEMALIYMVANSEAYLADLLYLLLTARPETLKSSKQVTVAEVIDAESREGLISDLARREVNSWTYQSFKEQVSRLTKEFGMNFREIESSVESIKEAHARRNLFVHRGGVVDETYLEIVPGTSEVIGKRISADEKYVVQVSDALLNFADVLTTDVRDRCLSE